MKILFLDIDGVLNCQSMPREDRIKTAGGLISKRCLKLLNELIDETGCKIVVSSTWRKDTSHDLFETLYNAGLIKESLIGKTPDFNTPYMLRGNEIRAWLKMYATKNGVTSYAIVDDDSDMLLWQAENFIATDGWVGLTPSITHRIKRVFNTVVYDGY